MKDVGEIKWYTAKILDNLTRFTGHNEEFIKYISETRSDDYNISGLPEHNEDNGDILIPVFKSEKSSKSYLVGMISQIFRQEGYSPIILVCDSILPWCKCDNNQHCSEFRKKICSKTGQKIFGEFDIQQKYISQYIQTQVEVDIPESIEGCESFEIDGIQVGKYLSSELRASHKEYTIGEERISEFRKAIKSSVLIINAIDNIIQEYNFKAVLSDHPIYIQGIALSVARSRGIPTYGYDLGNSDQQIIFSQHKSRGKICQYTNHEFVKNELRHPLTDGEKEEIDSYIYGRSDGEQARFDYAGQKNIDLSNKKWNKKIAIFTNLLWDASLSSDDSLFRSPREWLDYSVNNVDESVALIVKTHPAESVRGTNESVISWLKEYKKCGNDNLYYLSPETKISPYSLINEVDLVSVWNSTIGLEAAYRGIPVVTAGDAHYQGHKFTFDPTNRAEYIRMLDNIDSSSFDEKMTSRAQRYAHLLYCRKHFDFPFYDTQDHKTKIKEYNSITKIINDCVDTEFIVSKIINNEPVVRKIR